MNTFRVVFYLLTIMALSIYFNYSYIAINFIKLPGIIEEAIVGESKVIFIYGNPCSACASGAFLNSLRSQTENYKLIYVLSPEYSRNDTVNLIRTFSLDGKIIKGDSFVKKTREKIIRLAKQSAGGSGFCLTISKKGRIKKITLF